jgi:hypothetical protein
MLCFVPLKGTQPLITDKCGANLPIGGQDHENSDSQEQKFQDSERMAKKVQELMAKNYSLCRRVERYFGTSSWNDEPKISD